MRGSGGHGHGGDRRAGVDGRPVAIAGAGPVGLVLANLLGSAGVPVVVYERDRAPTALPRAVHLDDDALRTLQATGLGRAITDATTPSGGMDLVGADGRVFWRFRRPLDERPHGHPRTSLMHQPAVEAVLRRGLDRFPHVLLRPGWEVVDARLLPDPADPDPDNRGGVRVVAASADGRTVVTEASFLVGCDGAGSGIRRRFGLGLIDHGFEQRWLVIDTREAPPLDTHPLAQQVCDPARPSTYVPVGGPDGRRCRWEFLVHPGEDTGALTATPRMSALVAPWLGVDARPQVERVAVYRFHAVRARRWRSGAVLVAGDAAHQMPPFLGQGLCAGIRDAANLAWKLRLVRDGLATEALLDTYQCERSPHVRTVTALSSLLGRVVHGGDVTGRVLRGLLRAAAMLPPPLRTAAEQPSMPGLPTGQLVPRGSVPARLLRRVRFRRWGAAAVGRPFPQPYVRWAGREVLLDEVLGDGFAVVVNGAAPELDEPTARWFARLGRMVTVDGAPLRGGCEGDGCQGAAQVEDLTGALTTWFLRHHAVAAVVRPDRYVYAAPRRPAGLPRALGDLRTALG